MILNFIFVYRMKHQIFILLGSITGFKTDEKCMRFYFINDMFTLLEYFKLPNK